MRKMKVPFSPPDIGEEEIREVVDTLKSGWITTGPKTKQFEKEIAAFCHTQTAVCLNSDTACMETTLRVLGVGPGDEVITSAYTYTASASVICHVDAPAGTVMDPYPGILIPDCPPERSSRSWFHSDALSSRTTPFALSLPVLLDCPMRYAIRTAAAAAISTTIMMMAMISLLFLSFFCI